MAENKTKPTTASVDDYIDSRANAQQREDCRKLMTVLKKATGERPQMWGSGIVGYGKYRYTYESGRSGEAPLTGFAIRGREIVVYAASYGPQQKTLLSKLGKHRTGKFCLYFKQMADIDATVLEELVVNSVNGLKERYGDGN